MGSTSDRINQIRREQLAAGAQGGREAVKEIDRSYKQVGDLRAQGIASISASGQGGGRLGQAAQAELDTQVRGATDSRLRAIDQLRAQTAQQTALGNQQLGNYLSAAQAAEGIAIAEGARSGGGGGGGSGSSGSSGLGSLTDAQAEKLFLDQAAQATTRDVANLGKFDQAVQDDFTKSLAPLESQVKAAETRAEAADRRWRDLAEQMRRSDAHLAELEKAGRAAIRKGAPYSSGDPSGGQPSLARSGGVGNFGDAAITQAKILAAKQNRARLEAEWKRSIAEQAEWKKKAKDLRANYDKTVEQKKKERDAALTKIRTAAAEKATGGVSQRAYDLAVQNGMDPVLALALFTAEDDAKYQTSLDKRLAAQNPDTRSKMPLGGQEAVLAANEYAKQDGYELNLDPKDAAKYLNQEFVTLKDGSTLTVAEAEKLTEAERKDLKPTVNTIYADIVDWAFKEKDKMPFEVWAQRQMAQFPPKYQRSVAVALAAVRHLWGEYQPPTSADLATRPYLILGPGQ